MMIHKTTESLFMHERCVWCGQSQDKHAADGLCRDTTSQYYTPIPSTCFNMTANGQVIDDKKPGIVLWKNAGFVAWLMDEYLHCYSTDYKYVAVAAEDYINACIAYHARKKTVVDATKVVEHLNNLYFDDVMVGVRLAGRTIYFDGVKI